MQLLINVLHTLLNGSPTLDFRSTAPSTFGVGAERLDYPLAICDLYPTLAGITQIQHASKNPALGFLITHYLLELGARRHGRQLGTDSRYSPEDHRAIFGADPGK